MTVSELKFRYPWRPYQARVLKAIEHHLDDNKLHIVAAPGAGKTTLGLEVFRLLGRPTLALAPTRIIRDQWIDRLRDFTETDNPQALPWVSNTIKTPAFFTSITYQALHAQFADELLSPEQEAEIFENDPSLNENELNHFIQLVAKHNISVLILDEAHHLRSEWWKAMDRVCAHFPKLTLISLTATPPYGSEGNEWMRYAELCGPIDEEISIPELVKANTLCAHQDFVWACDASANEKRQIAEHDKRVSTLCASLLASQDFERAVLSHPWLHDTMVEDDVVKHPKVAVAILCFMRAKNLPLNKALMRVIDLGNRDIPELGRRWWQILVEAVLFSAAFSLQTEHQDFIVTLKRQLKASELLNKRELSLAASRRTERCLSLSTAKIMACARLHELEHGERGDELRQVFLADYIRDEALTTELSAGTLNLGAWPIFREITKNSPIPKEIALLTGRLTILHHSKLPALFAYAGQSKLSVESLAGTDQYLKIVGSTNLLTNALTELLNNGEIKALVGTRSLLGEGWDAPVINSLVLASTVGSFMLTNQMRGRAIRIDKSVPEKTSSIWHLVAINPDSFFGWSDFVSLNRRFDTFVGLSEKEPVIESGFDRMDAKALASSSNTPNLGGSIIARNNRDMTARFKKLVGIKQRWQEALTLDAQARIVPSVKTDTKPRLRSLILAHSWAYLLLQLAIALACGSWVYLQALPTLKVEPILLLVGIGICTLLYKLPKTLSVLRIVFRHLPVDGSLKQMGRALAEALCRAGFIDTPHDQLSVKVSKNYLGHFNIALKGGTFYESSLFSDCMAEILAPIEMPRYLVVREGEFLGMIRDDYHAVPMKLAAQKPLAELFLNAWRKHVSTSELIYTRTPAGRKRLLKAKRDAFSSTFEKQIKRQDRWQ